MEKETDTQTRVRMNIKTTAKGLVQFDVTSEFPTVEEAKLNLDNAIKAIKEVIASNGYKEAEQQHGELLQVLNKEIQEE